MKKIYSFVAALVVAMVVFVSCGSGLAFEKEIDEMTAAVSAKDYAKLLSTGNTILTGKDKATAADLVSAGLLLSTAVAQQQQAGQVDAQNAIDLYTKASELFTAGKSKSDYQKVVDAFKAKGQDIEALANNLPQAITAFKNAIEAQAQQAAAAEEGEEGEEDAE
jgi:hypothetical protein